MPTALTKVGEDDEGAVRLAGELFDGWDIGGVANGGYLLALAGRAVSVATGRTPLSITARTICGPDSRDRSRSPSARSRPADSSRPSSTTCAVTAPASSAGSRCRANAPAARSTTSGWRHPTSRRTRTSTEATVPADETGAMGQRPKLMDRLALRMRPGDADFRVGRPTGRDDVAGWFAFADGRPVDELAVLLAVDSFAPAVFNMLGNPSWVPTVELTVHLRAEPDPGPLRCSMRSDVVTGGFLNEDGTIWDSAGHLVAQSRQLGLLPRGS